MKTIELTYTDRTDLMILYSALNTLADLARRDLANHQCRNKKIESDWINETAKEWEKLMTLKAQVLNAINKE